MSAITKLADSVFGSIAAVPPRCQLCHVHVQEACTGSTSRDKGHIRGSRSPRRGLANFEPDVPNAELWHIKCRSVTIVFRSGGRAPDCPILPPEHSWLQFDHRPGTFNRTPVT